MYVCVCVCVCVYIYIYLFLFFLKFLSLERRQYYTTELLRYGLVHGNDVLTDAKIQGLYSGLISELMDGNSSGFGSSPALSPVVVMPHSPPDLIGTQSSSQSSQSGLHSLVPFEPTNATTVDIRNLASAATAASEATASFAPGAASALAALAAAASVNYRIIIGKCWSVVIVTVIGIVKKCRCIVGICRCIVSSIAGCNVGKCRFIIVGK